LIYSFVFQTEIKETLKFQACLISPIPFEKSKNRPSSDYAGRLAGVLPFESAFFARVGAAPLLEALIVEI